MPDWWPWISKRRVARAVEALSTCHRMHVQELKEQIETLRTQRDNLRIQLETRQSILWPGHQVTYTDSEEGST